MTNTTSFQWPDGKRMALSLSFDDARPSQLDNGIPILDAHGVKATFYVTLSTMQKRLDDWRRALTNGHEIGNHSVHHACTGNFPWSRDNALEDFTLETMEADLTGASAAIRDALGVTPSTFAYPCGQKFVGRGETLHSYVPLVARHFLAGRGFRDEVFNAPSFCDLAQACGTDSDDTPFEKLKLWLDVAAQQGGWVIFCSHDVGEYERQGMRVAVLDGLCRYATNPANGIWIDSVATIADYVKQHR